MGDWGALIRKGIRKAASEQHFRVVVKNVASIAVSFDLRFSDKH
jgi:hypothetical protein